MSYPLAIITGGTSGIGLASARQLARDHQLALVYRNQEERAGQAREQLGERAHLFRADLTQHDQRQRVFSEIGQLFPDAPVVLINAAGIAPPGQHFLRMRQLAPLHQIMEVNYLASAAMIARYLPAMLTQGRGVIINLSSASSLGSNPGHIGYSESKAALRCLTRNLAAELTGTGVTVHCLSPARVETPMTAEWLAGVRPETINYPLGRCLTAGEVAAAVALLVRAGSALHGLDLVLDGGHGLSHPGSLGLQV